MKKTRYAKVTAIITDEITGKFIEKITTYWTSDNVDDVSVLADECIETMTNREDGEKWEIDSFEEVTEDEYLKWKDSLDENTQLILDNLLLSMDSSLLTDAGKKRKKLLEEAERFNKKPKLKSDKDNAKN